MTELNRTASTADSTIGGIAPGGAVAAGVLREAEAWTELLSGIGAIWADWLRRQQEAIDASAQSLQQMFECRNPTDFAQRQQQWLADATRRGAADFSTLASESMALTWRAVGADRLGGRSPVRGAARVKAGDEAPLQRAAAE